MTERTVREQTLKVKLCQKCGAEYPLTFEKNVCAQDGGQLIIGDGRALVGKVLADRYEVQQLVGMGGWSAVYLAQDRQLHRSVAIKLLHNYLRSDQTRIKRFQREAQAASSLQHTHISTIFDCGLLENGQPYIVMEYLEGVTLEDMLAQEGQFPVKRLVAIAKQVAEALDHAHKRGIVHRDLKPGNILLMEGDYVKLVDFGLAKFTGTGAAESLTTTGQTFGTPSYMSPEQCRGEELDGRSDIYCLGVIMHEALCGKKLFASDSIFEAMHKHVMEIPPTLAKQRPDLFFPPALEEIVKRCIAKDRNDRFATPEALREALESLTNPSVNVSGITSGVQPHATPPAGTPAFIKPLLIGALIFALLCGGAYAVFTMQHQGSSTNTSDGH